MEECVKAINLQKLPGKSYGVERKQKTSRKYRVSQFELANHVGMIELVETNKKAYVYIWPIVKIEGAAGS